MRILLPTDGSEHSRNALRFLVARQNRDPKTMYDVELFNAQHTIPETILTALALDSVRNAFLSEGAEVLHQLILDAGDINVSKKVVSGEPAAAIVAEADAMGADVIAMGSRGLAGIEGFFLGSVSAKVLSLAKRPILLIRDRVPRGPMRIGICADGSKTAHAAAEFVAQHADFMGADASYAVINVSDTKESFHAAIEPAMSVLEDAGLPAQRVHLKGKAGDEIINYAAKSLDMLILGSHGYGNFRAAFMGSTAIRVTAGTDVPLLVIK